MSVKFRMDDLDGYYPTGVADVIRRERRLTGYSAPSYREAEPLAPYINNNEKTMKKGFTVLKLSELATQLRLPSSKGHKTKVYLELVINQIEGKGLRFVQFLQLVDVLYVIVEKVESQQSGIPHVYQPADKFRPDEEIQVHYAVHDTPPTPAVPVVQERELVTEAPPELENIKKRDHLKKSMKKNPLPWENNKR